MNRRHLVLICILIAACQRARQQPPASLARSSQPAGIIAEATEKKRPVYPYSIIEGGAYTPFELTVAKRKDPVVERHYRNINPDALKPLRLTADTSAYVSYRVGKLVFWTSHKINLKRGELVLSDGKNWVRGRCGNLISETPQLPVLLPVAMEPKAELMESPTTLKAMTPLPAETLETLKVEPVTSHSGAFSEAQLDKPNAFFPAVPQENQGWNQRYSTSGPGGIIGSSAGGGGGGGGAAGGSPTAPTTTPYTNPGLPPVLTGYPPNPFLPPAPTIDLLTSLPPYQSILQTNPTPLLPPQSITPNVNSAPLYITYLPPLIPQTPTPYPYNPPVTVGTVPNIMYVYPPPAPPHPDPPPHPPGVSQPPLYPPDLYPPNTPPTFTTPPDSPPDSPPQIATPEPATVVVTGVSLLLLAGYYLLARMRLR